MCAEIFNNLNVFNMKLECPNQFQRQGKVLRYPEILNFPCNKRIPLNLSFSLSTFRIYKEMYPCNLKDTPQLCPIQFNGDRDSDQRGSYNSGQGKTEQFGKIQFVQILMLPFDLLNNLLSSTTSNISLTFEGMIFMNAVLDIVQRPFLSHLFKRRVQRYTIKLLLPEP